MSAAHNSLTPPVSLETFWELVAANPDKRLEYRDGVVIDKDMAPPPLPTPISLKAFWELVNDNPDKRFEYRGGIVVEKSVPAGSIHAGINANCRTMLRTALYGKCNVFPLGMYVQPAADQLYLPDMSVSSVKQSRDERNILHAPELVGEVVPRATVAFDSIIKLADYRKCSSITTILLVWQDERRVEVHERESDRFWSVGLLEGAEHYQLRHFPILLDLDAIYRGIRIGA